MRSRILIKYIITVLTLLIAFLIYLCFSPKITSKPTLDKHENAVLLIDGEKFPYHPAVRFNNSVTWRLNAKSVYGDNKPDITINPETGQVAWSEKQGGLWVLTITASNWLGTDSQTFLVKHVVRPYFNIEFPSIIPAGSEFTGSVKIAGTQPMELMCDDSQIKFGFAKNYNQEATIRWLIPKAGKYSIRFGARNQAGEYHQSWDVIVKELPVEIISEPLTEAVLGKDYIYEVLAAGSPEFTWELLEYPEGMSIDKDGTLTFPAENIKEGEYITKIKVSNKADGRIYTDEQQYTLISRKQETVTREIPIDDVIKIVKREPEQEPAPEPTPAPEEETTMEEPPDTVEEVEEETTEEEPPDKVEETEEETTMEEPPDTVEEVEAETTTEEPPDKVEEAETTEEEPPDKVEEAETIDEEPPGTPLEIELEEISVPVESSEENIEKGKEIGVDYYIDLQGWSFNEFWRFVYKHKLKVLYISASQGVVAQNYEMSGLDSRGNPVLEMRSFNKKYYSFDGIYVDQANKNFGKYNKYLYEEYDTDPSYEYKMVLFFPYNFLGAFKRAAEQHYSAYREDPAIQFEEGAGKVKFTITKDYKFKILSMGNTK